MSNFTERAATVEKSLVSRRAAGLPESSTVRIADLAARMRRAGEDVLDVSAGRASEATEQQICEVAAAAMFTGRTHQTPARGAPDYLDAVAEKLRRENDLRVDRENGVMATLGCKNGLTLALLSILDPGAEVIVEDPCFVSYGPTITLAGGRPVPVPLRPEARWTWTPEDLDRAITRETRAIILCSPGNPTGTVHTEADLAVIAEKGIEHDLIVIADEIYEALAWGGRVHTPMASLPGMAERTIGLMGMTKSFAMGGWRIGYAYGPAEIIERMTMMQQHLMTCASSIAQAGGACALSAQMTEHMKQNVWPNWERRCASVRSAFNAMPNISVGEIEGGYYAWTDISQTGLTSDEFSTRLLKEQKVATVPGITFGPSCDDYVRITCVKSDEDNEKLIDRVGAFCASLNNA